MSTRQAFCAVNPVAGSLVRGAASALVCLALILPETGFAASVPPGGTLHKKSSKAASKVTPELTQHERVLHALSRFTFGPRPGDEAAVSAMGLDRWFEQQLHPQSIPDAALDQRLARFPAMQLSQTELVERFPTPGMLRQYSRGGLGAPEDPVERAIYADAALGYEEKLNNLQTGAGAATKPPAAVPGGSGMPATQPARDLMTGSNAGAPRAGVAANGIAPGPSAMPTQLPLMRVSELTSLPPEQRFQRLLALTPEEMRTVRSSLRGDGDLLRGLSPAQAEQVVAMQSPERLIGSEVLATRLLRDVYSDRQLQAVMTDFWLNHFSVYLRKNQNEPYLLPAYEREAILPNALGRFEDLLVATAQSPAMLVYLDNWESVGPHSRAAERAQAVQANRPGTPLAKVAKKAPQGINENYARELMELHTLGVNGGYTQKDVIEVAKCFTGWTIDRPAEGGEFFFNPNRHEPGPKVVLGHTIPESGEGEALAVLHLLATSPATAHFISLKLAQRFVSDTPPPTLVDRMSASYLKSGGEIRSVLETMFHSPEFWQPAVYRAKLKTPQEFLVSALRVTGADVSNPVPLVQSLERLGMPLYGMQTPNGYASTADAWVSSNALLTRLNFSLVLSGGRLPGTQIRWPELVGPEPVGPEPAGLEAVPDEAAEARLETVLLGQPAAPQTRAAALAEANDPSAQQQAQKSLEAAGTPANGAPAAGGMANPGPAFVPRRGGRLQLVNNTGKPEAPLATVAGLLLGSPDFQRR